MIDFAFDADDDTIAFLGVACWCLQRYFGHSEESARDATNTFVKGLTEPDALEWLHHDGPFFSALRIHHMIDLGGKWSEFTEWRVKEGYGETPSEVHEYMLQHYFNGPST